VVFPFRFLRAIPGSDCLLDELLSGTRTPIRQVHGSLFNYIATTQASGSRLRNPERRRSPRRL
jgi:hypothetical protein